MVFALHAVNPVRCILVNYAGILYVETVIIYIKVSVNPVRSLKLDKPLKH
jgi:hypothetical protein